MTFLALGLSNISRRGIDTTVRGVAFASNRVSTIEDMVSCDGGTLNLDFYSGSTIRASDVSLISRIRPKTFFHQVLLESHDQY